MKTLEAGVPKKKGILAITLMGCMICTGLFAYTDGTLRPVWWDERNVETTDNSLFINDQAPANQGQVKWVALQAYEEFKEKLPEAANSNIQQRVDGFTDHNNFLPVNLGQLKQVAAPCYDRLFEYGLSGSYPWEGNPDLANDYAIATIGQLKDFFNFELPPGTNLYYVATDGLDGNLGTIDQPFQTISHAVQQLVPGDTVLIRGGTYREQVTLTMSGTPELPITIMGYGDEFPTIKGSHMVTNWVHYQDNIWMVTNWTINSQQVFDDGFPLQQIGYPHQIYKDNPSWYNLVGLGIDDMMPGSFFWDKDASQLYVWLFDGQPPPPNGLEVSTIIRPFHGGSAAYIHLHRLRFQHSAYPWGGAVILGLHSTIRNCDILWGDFIGLSMKNNSSAINCNISNNGNSGIGGNTATNLLIRGCTITSNNYRHFNPNWHAGGIKLIPDASATVEHNSIAWNKGHGIWFDGCNENQPIKIRNNYVHHNQTGIFIEVSPGSTVYNNLVVSNDVGICVSESSNVDVFNNTIVGSYGYAAIKSSAAYSRISNGSPFFGNHYLNNLLYGNISTHDIILPIPTEYIWDNKSDYNCIYRTDGTAKFGGYGALVSGLENWQQVSGQDIHSLSSHPQMLNPMLNDYGLGVSSPCIDAGTNLTELSTHPYDLASQPRIANGIVDIGAYEFDGFEHWIRPEIRITSPGNLYPYDMDTLRGSMNSNIEGALSALIISGSTTNWVPVTSFSLYSWSLDISNFEIGQEYTITIYGTNEVGSLAQQTVTITRGDIGTGKPALSITTPDQVIQESGVVQISGTNNLHVAIQMGWSNRYNQAYISGGQLTAIDSLWNMDVAELYPGYNEIHVFGTNDWGVVASDMIVIDYGNTTNHFIAVDSPTPNYPYTTWNTAARTIQEAINAASDGDTVFVTNGIYQTGFVEYESGRTRVLVDKGITLESINGPNETIIKGNNAYPWPPYSRCVTLDHIDAELIGFTLSEGYANGLNYGGGVLILDMNIMSNCIVTTCSSPISGGGICLWGASGKGHGLLTSSVISENMALWGGGGIMIQWGNLFILENCIISDNIAINKGGGLTIDNCTRVRNCLVVDNHAGGFGGGLVLGNNSKAYNCTIENNTSLKGGVAIDAPQGIACIYNSIFYNNDPDNMTAERTLPDKTYAVEFCHTTLLPSNLTSTIGSITSNPLYLYPYGGDYRLSSGSSCLDTGTMVDWMIDSTAMNNTNRILYGQPDRGCYEFDGSVMAMRPLVETFSPTGWISYDESNYVAYGGRNINTTEIQATLTTNGITNNLTVSFSGNYDWDIEPFELEPEVTNTVTLIGLNAESNRVEQTFSVIRGGIGTGTPVISITNAPLSVTTSTILVVNGTNNMHAVGRTWNLYEGNIRVDTGTFALTGIDWNLSMTNLTAGTYALDIVATNAWGESAWDTDLIP